MRKAPIHYFAFNWYKGQVLCTIEFVQNIYDCNITVTKKGGGGAGKYSANEQ